MAKQLFGTDGIRGLAGEFPLDPQTVYAVGSSLGSWSARHAADPEVVVGVDTRESGAWLAEHLAGGLRWAGVRVRFAGLITTPGIAYLTSTGPFVAGIMISASHNLYQDNGIKVFGHSGFKLPDEAEHGLEEEILRMCASGISPLPAPVEVEEDLDAAYLEHLAATYAGSLRGFRIVADCGHGAATHLAPALLRRLGAQVNTIGCEPNGRNINLHCGATNVEALRREVLASGAQLGVAFDGDADRAIFVAPGGKPVDGDHVLLICARHMLGQRRLGGNNGTPVVVATVMSNLGLEKALARLGIGLVRTPVGDKYVLEEMLRRGATLGGEQSGHVIYREYATTGDGLLTALRVLEVMSHTGRGLDELSHDLVVYPQVLRNTVVRERRPLEDIPAVKAELDAVRAALGDRGRLLVRYSGTEPVARVMVEGPDHDLVNAFAERILAAIRSEIGA